MRNLVNVVHPHSLKMIRKSDDSFQFEVGTSSDINKPRDEKVVSFLEEASKNSSRILVHMEYSGGLIDRAMRKMSFEHDPVYKKFMMETEKDCFYTLASGTPIPNKMPEGIQRETWNLLRRNVISTYKLQKRSEGFSNVFFIGGFLERCLGNYIHYFSNNYAKNGEKLFCVEDLCATFDEKDANRIKNILIQENVKFVKHQEAIDLLDN